jgi:hypothetical protein
MDGLDKFCLSAQGDASSSELDFFGAVKALKPADRAEPRQAIPPDFYALLDINKNTFMKAAATEKDDAAPRHKGGANDAYIMKRLRAKEIRHYQGFTDDDEAFLGDVARLLTDGALPRPTAKKVAEALKKEIEPLRVLGILKRDIPVHFFRATHAQSARGAASPREVILSSWITGVSDIKGRSV